MVRKAVILNANRIYFIELLPKEELKQIRVLVTAITPTTIHLFVNVTSPSTVWCITSKEGEVLNNELIKKTSVRNDVIGITSYMLSNIETTNIALKQLTPNTSYDVHCLCDYSKEETTVSETVKISSVLTRDGISYDLTTKTSLFLYLRIK